VLRAAALALLLAGCAAPSLPSDPRVACHALDGDEPHDAVLVLRVNNTYGFAHGRERHSWLDLDPAAPSVALFDLDARGAPAGTKVGIAWALRAGLDATVWGPSTVAVGGTQTCTLAVTLTPGPGARGEPSPIYANATAEPALTVLVIQQGVKFDA
jgi:hypothetical protein